MLKKFVMFALFFILMIGLIGCSSDEKDNSGKASSKGEDISVTIEGASYILAGDSDGISEEDNKGMLAVELAIKNNTKSALDVSTYDGVKLYDGEEQMGAQNNIYNAKVGIENNGSGEIGPEKKKTITAIFYVEKDKEYEIGVKPFVFDPDAKQKEVILSLDTSEYAESYEALNEPALALGAYIDMIYMNKENVDYEKYVSADKAALQDEAKNVFAEKIERVFLLNGVPDEEMAKHYETYKSLLAEKAEVNTNTTANANGKAVVSVEYSNLPLSDLSKAMMDYQSEYKDNTGDYDIEKAEEYALSKLALFLESIEAKPSRDKFEILLIQKDGKWTVDTSDWQSERLVDAFASGK